MKKIISVVMVLVMVMGLAGCQKNTENAVQTQTETASPQAEVTDDSAQATTDTATEAVTYPEKKVMIGVELYDPTESETLAIQKYFEYLSQNFNVEFKYSEAIADADQEMKFIEDCAMAGCTGFFGYYNVTGEEQVNKVVEYGMYYYGGTDDLYTTFKDEPKYLGMVTANGSDYDAGKALGEWVLDQGFDNVIYANGGADFGVAQFVNRQSGFMDTVGDKVTVTVVSGFPGDQFFADQAAALATKGLDAVVASFNGVDFWAQPIASAGLTNVKLATIGAVNQSYLDAFNNGSIAYLVAGDIQAYGFAVSLICNAVDGNADALKENGVATKYGVPTWYISTADECKKLLDIQENERVFSADELKSLVVKLNPDANAQTLYQLADSGNIAILLK